jgi:hypothetical protein
MARKQTGEVKMLMMGGMSKVRNSPFWMPCLLISIASVSQLEMKQWWVHHEGKLPIFEGEFNKDRVEDLTGCIPLLLQPLLEWKGQFFCDIEQQFWHHQELALVKTNIFDFDQRMTRTMHCWCYV